MSGIKPTQKIYDVVKDINEDRYRLPSIQRSFVWDEERICVTTWYGSTHRLHFPKCSVGSTHRLQL